MAEINTEGKGGKHKGKSKKISTRVDLTPMVDLAFLLITFFMLTTSMLKPQTMEIAMPSKDTPTDPPKLKQSLAVTIILGKNDKIFYFFGAKDEKTGAEPKIETTDFGPNSRAFIAVTMTPSSVMQVVLPRSTVVTKASTALECDGRSLLLGRVLRLGRILTSDSSNFRAIC